MLDLCSLYYYCVFELVQFFIEDFIIGVNPHHSQALMSVDALRLVGNVDELAFVLSRQLSHALAGHGKESYNRENLEKGFGIAYSPFGLLGWLCFAGALCLENLALSAGRLLLLPYVVRTLLGLAASGAREEEADLKGLFLMLEAGFDHGEVARNFTALGQQEEHIKEIKASINKDVKKQGQSLVGEKPW